MRWFLAIALLSSGCVFKVRSVDGAVAGDDLGADDLAVGGDDLGDMGGVPDDLAPPPDLVPPVLMLSHVPQHYLTDGTCDLVVTTSIDTSARKVDGNDVPAGCVFANESEAGPPAVDVTVLAAHSIVFNGTVKVSGTRGLVVVAGTTIQVNGTLDGSAVKATAGPGGAAATMGMGAGPSGKHSPGGMTFADSGGSGGSYGTVGGNGGPGVFNTDNAAAPGTSMAYGSMFLTASAAGGSGGGTGSSEACNGKNGGPGGAGGGSIQLSAGTSITISGGGSIDVGGGAGGGGCESPTNTGDEGSGGGGGSGGAVFLESPSVNVSGGLWANGGSGGGGASGDALNHLGQDGNDGTTTQTGATGGAAGGTFGGVGGDGSPPASATSANGASSANGGGGGGGAGRIVVRSRGAATIAMMKVSPPPALDPSIP